MSRQKFWRQIRLPRKAGEANLPDKTYGQELSHFPTLNTLFSPPKGERIAYLAGNTDLGLSSYYQINLCLLTPANFLPCCKNYSLGTTLLRLFRIDFDKKIPVHLGAAFDFLIK